MYTVDSWKFPFYTVIQLSSWDAIMAHEEVGPNTGVEYSS